MSMYYLYSFCAKADDVEVRVTAFNLTELIHFADDLARLDYDCSFPMRETPRHPLGYVEKVPFEDINQATEQLRKENE